MCVIMIDRRKENAFTLIELSIVLIIISLIVGGVVGGKSLIKSAELKSIISEHNTFQTAYNNFLIQYDDIPGDMANASEYWPGVAVDGNGNRLISGSWLAIEGVNSWHHLSLAGLVNGTFVGSNGAYGGGSELGLTVPASKMKGRGWALVDTGPLHSKNGNALGFMTPSTFPGGANKYPWGGSLTPRDAISIDKKFDDGDPRSGALYIGNAVPGMWLELCVNNTTGVMDFSKTSLDCGLVFWLD